MNLNQQPLALLSRLLIILLGMTFCELVWSAPTPTQIDNARTKGVAWLIGVQNGEGSWGDIDNRKVIDTTAAVDALRLAGVEGFSYASGIAYVSNASVKSNDTAARQAIAMINAGIDASGIVNNLLANRYAPTGSWGAYPNYAGSFPDHALVMRAIRKSGIPFPQVSGSLGYFSSSITTDQGWPYTVSDGLGAPQSQVIPTAYSVLSLIEYKSGYSVQTLIDGGIAALRAKQNANGSFGDGSIHETAIAYLAIAAEHGSTDVDALAAADFLIAQQNINGSWGNDAFLTGLALQTLPATVMADTDSDGIPNTVEPILGTDPNVADSRALRDSNGNNVVYVRPLILNVYQFEDVNYVLSASGGEPPYSWVLTSGTLPNGVNLTEGGLLAGVTSVVGDHVFVIEATDVKNNSTKMIGQIQVLESQLNGDYDKDGMPDSYEITHGFDPLNKADGWADADGDGLVNVKEYQHGTNPRYWDTDNDKMSDYFEVTYGPGTIAKLDALVAGKTDEDPDQDTLTNLVEYQKGTDPTTQDTDGDGFNDQDEEAMGRDPKVNEEAVILIINELILDDSDEIENAVMGIINNYLMEDEPSAQQ
jgi:hypothetical protein